MIILVLISYRCIMMGFQVFCKSLLISRSGPKNLTIKKEEEEKERERKSNHRRRRVLVCGLSSGTDTETGEIMPCVLQFSLLKQSCHIRVLLRPPLLSSCSLLFLGSHFPFFSFPLFFSFEDFHSHLVHPFSLLPSTLQV